MVPYVRDSGPISGTRPGGSSSRAGVARQAAGLLKTGTPLDLEHWTQSGACTPEDLGLFFAPDYERLLVKAAREKAAKKICSGCSIQVTCLKYALATKQKFGIYGGLTEEERAGLLEATR